MSYIKDDETIDDLSALVNELKIYQYEDNLEEAIDAIIKYGEMSVAEYK